MNEVAIRRATAEATANIAFIKYWGARDLEAAIPYNPSISMTLRECRSVCRAAYFEAPVRRGVLGWATS